MSSSSFGTLVAGWVQSGLDYVVAGLGSGNVVVYLIVLTAIGGIISLVVFGIKKIFHRR